MPARLYTDAPLSEGALLTLPPDTSRHAQVLRLQPGDALILFNGQGGEWSAEITRMGRQDVGVQVQSHTAGLPELPVAVTLALGMPANERMDALVEKATELGAVAVQPLQSARSVLKLAGDRADKRRVHWQGVAVAASEQCGRSRVPQIGPVQGLEAWLGSLAPAGPDEQRWLLSFADDAQGAEALTGRNGRVLLLSGPEGGLDEREETLARDRGFVPLSLGPRVLRADTAPLAALVLLGAGR